MTIPISSEIAEEITDLGLILGLVHVNGSGPELNTAWFGDPVGEMSGVLADDARRRALVDRAAELLGATPDELDLPDIDDAESWIPIAEVKPSASSSLDAGLYAIIDARSEPALVSLGARLSIDRDGVAASATIRVPLAAADPVTGVRLLPGTDDGPIDLAATIEVDGLGVPGVVTLGGVCLTASVPTGTADTPSLSIVAKNLLLAGDTTPVDMTLGDALDDLGAAAMQVFAALLVAQDDSPPAVQDLLALIGLDPTGVIPALPIADLISDGIPALRAWVTDVVDAQLDAWLDRLGSFLGGDPATGGSPIAPQGSGTPLDPYRICIVDDNIEACLTLAVETDAAAGSVSLAPGASIRANTAPGATVPGFVEGAVTFATLLLDQGFSLTGRPTVRALAQLGDPTSSTHLIDTTVDAAAVRVGALRAGLRSTIDGQLVPMFEALDVDVDATAYDIVDLSDADSVIAAATGGLVDLVIDALDLDVVDEARALAELAGLIAPDGTIDWPLVDIAHLLADPIGAIGCYHVEVLSVAGRWAVLAERLAVVLRSAVGVTPTAVGGGTIADPWTIVLFDNEGSADPVTGRVELIAWAVGDPADQLSVGLRTAPTFDVVGVDANVHYQAELLHVGLPTAATCPAPVTLVWAPTHSVVLTIDDPTLSLPPVVVAADRLQIGLDLDRAVGVTPRFVADDLTVAIDGSSFDLGDLDLGDLGSLAGLGDLAGLDWTALRLLLGDFLAGLGIDLGDVGAELAALLGWKPGDPVPFTFPQLPDLGIEAPSLPTLDLQQLLLDPFATLTGWLADLFSVGDGTPLELPSFVIAIGRLARVLTLGHPDPPDLTLDGRGTYDDPWAICLDGGPLELLLWLDPDGPSLSGVVGLADHLLPDGGFDLSGGETPAEIVERAIGHLERARQLIPEIGSGLSDAGALTNGLLALRELLEGDGIVTATSQHPSGWTRVDLSPTAHFLEPGSAVLPQVVVDDIAENRRIFVSSAALPATTDWPGSLTDIDLSEPGLRPESLDLSAVTGGGPWHVVLPSRADAVVPTEPGVAGIDRLRARLRRAVDHIHGIVGGELALIAHSTTGQVARLLASEPAADTNVRHVVTIGTPHAGASFEFLDRPETGEALRTLQRFARLIDGTPSELPADVRPLTDLLDTIGSVLDPSDGGEFVPLPVTDFTVPVDYPDLGAGTTGHAVVGTVAPTDLDTALLAFVRRVIETGLGLLPAGEAITHLGVGLRARLVDVPVPSGTIEVRGRARVDLHRVRLGPGDSHRPIPFVSADVAIRRVDGWLLGGPDPARPIGSPRDPRARWLETHLRADVSDLDGAEISIVVHDASVFGVHRDRWVVDTSTLDGGETLLPEVRILLGETFRGLGTLVVDTALEQFADLLFALGLAELVDGRIGLVTDAVERFVIDPVGEIRTRLALARAEVRAALARLVPVEFDVDATIGVPPMHTIALGEHVAVALDLGIQPCISIEMYELSIGGLFDLSASSVVCLDGTVRADLLARRADAPGPLGATALRVRADADTVTAQLESVIDDVRLPVLLADPIVLFPVPADTVPHAVLALRALAGDVTRRAVEFLNLQFDATQRIHAESMFAAIGVHDGQRVRNPLGLLTRPAEWLSAPGVLSPPTIPDGPWVPCLSRDGLAQLLDAIAGVLEIPVAGGALSLPWGATIGVVAAGDGAGVHVMIGWDAPVGGGAVSLDGSLDLFVSCGLDVAATVTTVIEVSGGALDLLRVSIDAGATIDVGVDIRAAGGDEIALTLLPTLGGLDSIDVGAAAQSLLALVLDAVVADTTVAQLGAAIGGLGDGLALRAPAGFDAAQLRLFAANPAAALLAVDVGGLFGDLADLIGLLGITSTVTPGPNPTLTVEPMTGVSVSIGSPLELCVTVTGYEPIDGVRTDGEMCVEPGAADPLRFRAEVEVIDPALLTTAGISLFPRVAFYLGGAGAASPDPADRFEAGLWIEAPGVSPRHALIAKVPFATTGSGTVVVCRTDATDSEDLAECLAAAVASWVTPLAAELVLAVDDVHDFLEGPILDASTSLRTLLEDAEILASGAFSLAGGVMDDLSNRLFRLLGEAIEAASALATLTIDPFTLTLSADTAGGRTTYGFTLGLADELVLGGSADIRLSLTGGGGGVEGITVELFSIATSGSDLDLDVDPAISVDGVGVRVDHPTGGKLVDLIAGVDAVELLVDLSLGSGADTAAIELGFENLTLPIGLAQGDNPVAAKVLSSANEENEAGDAEELAPALNPRVEIGLLPSPSVAFRLDVGDPPWWIPIQQSFGPIYVEQIGGDTTVAPDGTLEKIHILLDGEVSLAGLTVGVDDLAVVIPVVDAGDLSQWGIDLAGLAVGYSGSGVELAGGFRRSETPAGIEYVGMAQLDAFGYGLSAIGAYGEFTDPALPGETYTSMFVFAALSAPLGGPPFFFITGIGAGLGLNRELVLPDVDGIPGFPLVTAMNGGFASDPTAALEDIGTSFPGRNGTFWLAAGIRFNSFVLLETVAVLSVEIGDGVEVALLGLSHAALPDADAPIANIELALIARFSTEEGVLWVQAQLTDNSWLLDRDCRLTGGFAFVVWFKRGEFVFTVGGYHPRFTVPDYFPAVPRVGFNWTVDNALVIKGESYFALTSSAVMAGGALEASYNTSTVWASLSMGVDALVEWDPFFYDVSAYVRVSAGIDVRICVIWCARIRLSFSMGASVRVWGPELQGRVDLELGPIDVTVKFGSNAKDEILTITWSEFVSRFLVQGDANGESMSLAITSGLLTPDTGETSDTDDGTAARPWRVLPEFSVRFETRAASTDVVVNGATRSSRTGTNVSEFIDAAAAGLTGLTSTFRARLFDGDGAALDDALEVEQFVIGKLPDGPWKYVERESRAPASDYIEAFNGVTLASTLEVADDDIIVDLSTIELPSLTHPLPFHFELLSRSAGPILALLQGSLDFSSAAPVETDLVYDSAVGALDSHSRPARATLTTDRVSPPRLAPLTEGMVDDVREPAPTTPRATPPQSPPRDRTTHPPIVMGVLRGALASEVRAPEMTTVEAGADVPRVTAPTLAATRATNEAFSRAQLTIASSGVRARNGTVVADGHQPRTAPATRGREFRAGYRAAPRTARQIATIERRLLGQGHAVAAGDVVVLRLPNERFDEQPERPHLEVDGDQAMRLVCLDRAGLPVSARSVRSGTVDLPRNVSRIVAQGLGARRLGARSRVGLAGWHAQMTVHQVTSNTYLASDAIIRSAANRTRRTGSPVSIANLTARDATAGRTVVTYLPAASTVVLIGLAPAEPVSDLLDAFASVTIGLDGATRRTQPDGTVDPPRLVVSGDQLFGVFAVGPDRRNDRDESATAWTRVTIESDQRWNVIAVGGTGGRPDSLVDDLRDGDPRRLFSRGADPTGSSTLRFVAAKPAKKPSAKKKPVAKKKPAKKKPPVAKKPAKKTPAKKKPPVAKKPAKKTPAKKRPTANKSTTKTKPAPAKKARTR